MAQYWYVKYDAAGNEIDRKAVTRGRPPKDYIKIDDTGNIVTEAVVISKPKVNISKQKTLYVKYDPNGTILDKKEVTRGRPPKGYEKVYVDDAGNITGKVEVIESTETTSTESTNTETTSTETVINEEKAEVVATEVVESNSPAEKVEITTVSVEPAKVVELSKPSYGNSKEINSAKSCTIDELKKYIEAGDSKVEGDITKMLACDILPGIEEHIDYLNNGMSVSRIDIDAKNNDVLVWRVHTKGDPDVVIKNAIKTTAAV